MTLHAEREADGAGSSHHGVSARGGALRIGRHHRRSQLLRRQAAPLEDGRTQGRVPVPAREVPVLRRAGKGGGHTPVRSQARIHLKDIFETNFDSIS